MSLISAELRRGLDSTRTKLAEGLFKAEVAAGRIQIRLRLERAQLANARHHRHQEPENADQLPSKTGQPLEKSLFVPVYKNEMNGDERDVAVYLDGEEALSWWHRNVARSQGGIQGGKRAKIYPDFIFAVEGEAKRITVLETKGDQLDNLDTAYKRDVLASSLITLHGTTPRP